MLTQLFSKSKINFYVCTIFLVRINILICDGFNKRIYGQQDFFHPSDKEIYRRISSGI